MRISLIICASFRNTNNGFQTILYKRQQVSFNEESSKHMSGGFWKDFSQTLKHAAWGPWGRGRGRAVGGPLKPRLGLACPPQSASHSSRWGSICVKSHGNDAVSGRGAHLEGRRLNLLYICPLGIRRRKDCERLSLWPGHERQRTVDIFLSGSIVMNCFSEGLKLSNRRHGTGMSAPVRTPSIQERSNSTQEVSGRWQAERHPSDWNKLPT